MEKPQFLQWSQNYKENSLNKDIKKEVFLKKLMNLIETNHQIKMTSDLSVSSNNSFKSQLNAKSFNMFLKLLQFCKVWWFCFSVCFRRDVNV